MFQFLLLQAKPLKIQLEIEKLIKQWRNNPEQMQFLENKANDQGKQLEQVLREDATWVVNQRRQNGELF